MSLLKTIGSFFNLVSESEEEKEQRAVEKAARLSNCIYDLYDEMNSDFDELEQLVSTLPESKNLDAIYREVEEDIYERCDDCGSPERETLTDLTDAFGNPNKATYILRDPEAEALADQPESAAPAKRTRKSSTSQKSSSRKTTVTKKTARKKTTKKVTAKKSPAKVTQTRRKR